MLEPQVLVQSRHESIPMLNSVVLGILATGNKLAEKRARRAKVDHDY